MILSPRKLHKRIRELEAEVSRLKVFEDRWNGILKTKRDLHEKRRKLLAFVHYKNWYREPRRFWPETLCCECSNVLPDGKHHLKCSKIGTRCSKYGSCDWAQPARKAKQERAA